MNATMRMDETVREFVLQHFCRFEQNLGPNLLREFIGELVGRWREGDQLLAPVSGADVDRLASQLQKEYASLLSTGAEQADVNRLIQDVAKRLAAEKKVELNPDLLTARHSSLYEAYLTAAGILGAERPTLFTEMGSSLGKSAIDSGANKCETWIARSSPWRWRRTTAMPSKNSANWPIKTACGRAIRPFSKKGEGTKLESLRENLDAAWAPHLFLWQKSKDDLLKEIDSVVRMPGWANIWTQPIINRIDMLATGVRTMIGVKVFGSDLDKIQKVSEQVAGVLRNVPGAVDVFPDQNVGKGYLEIKIDRDRAARYGVNVGDIQDVIETALGGEPITMTVEGRERFPVRVRYARTFREDEADVKNLLVRWRNVGPRRSRSRCRKLPT